MQKAVQPQTINVEGIGSKLTGKFTELLFDLFRNAHIKHALHQGFDSKQMSVDVLKVRHGLLKAVTGLVR